MTKKQEGSGVTEKPRNFGGRPTKYDPAYCEAVIEDAKRGFSLSAFCGGIFVDRDTITEWRKVHPEFDEACKVAKLVRARMLETDFIKLDIPAPAMNARKLALANCAEEDWRSEQVLKHVGGDKDDAPIRSEVAIDVTKLSEATLRELAGLRVESGE